MSGSELPPRPTCVADLDTLVHAKGHHRHTAHIPDPDSDAPFPFCGHPNRHHGATWEEKPPRRFSSDPDAWLSLCEHCVEEFERRKAHDSGDSLCGGGRA